MTGILLIQLGTPDAPTGRALRPYLRQFLFDPRVVETKPYTQSYLLPGKTTVPRKSPPAWLWSILMNGIILNKASVALAVVVDEYCGNIGIATMRSTPFASISVTTDSTDGLPTIMPNRTGLFGKRCWSNSDCWIVWCMSGEPVASSQTRAYFFADDGERNGKMMPFMRIDHSHAGGLLRGTGVLPGNR